MTADRWAYNSQWVIDSIQKQASWMDMMKRVPVATCHDLSVGLDASETGQMRKKEKQEKLLKIEGS